MKAVPLVLLAWALAFALFVAASILAGTHDTFPGDVWLAQRIQEIDSDAFARVLDWAEDSADTPMVALVSTAAAFLLLFLRDARGGLLIWAAVLTRVLTTWIAKELIERPRPSADLLDFTSQPSTFSFPSGHAAGAFVLYGLVFYFATLHIPHTLARAAVQLLCVLLILGAGLERVYVGHHWPSDVLGGYLHGALIVSAAIALHHWSPHVRLQVTSGRPHRFHVRRQHEEQIIERVREP